MALAEWSDPGSSPRGAEVLEMVAATPTQFSNSATRPSQRHLFHTLVEAPPPPRPALAFLIVAEPALDKATAAAALASLKDSLLGRPDWLRVAEAPGPLPAGQKPLQAQLQPVLAQAAVSGERRRWEGKRRSGCTCRER